MRNGREIDAVHIFLRYVPHRQWQVQRLQCFTQDAQKRRHEKDMKGIVGTQLGSQTEVSYARMDFFEEHPELLPSVYRSLSHQWNILD